MITLSLIIKIFLKILSSEQFLLKKKRAKVKKLLVIFKISVEETVANSKNLPKKEEKEEFA